MERENGLRCPATICTSAGDSRTGTVLYFRSGNSASFLIAASFVEILRYPAKEVVDGTEGAESGSEEVVQRPTPKPRSSKSPDPPVPASNLVPSRSAPAPPNSQQRSRQSLPNLSSSLNSTLPRPKPRKLTKSVSSSNRVDMLESELAVS